MRSPIPFVTFRPPRNHYKRHRSPSAPSTQNEYEQALVSLKLKKSVDAEGGRTFAVRIEGG